MPGSAYKMTRNIWIEKFKSNIAHYDNNVIMTKLSTMKAVMGVWSFRIRVNQRLVEGNDQLEVFQQGPTVRDAAARQYNLSVW